MWTRRARSTDAAGSRGSCLAAHDRDRAPETLARDPSCQAREIVGNNILGVNVTAWSDPPSQPHRVIAAPRAYVGHGKTGVHAEQVHDVLCFARPVAQAEATARECRRRTCAA